MRRDAQDAEAGLYRPPPQVAAAVARLAFGPREKWRSVRVRERQRQDDLLLVRRPPVAPVRDVRHAQPRGVEQRERVWRRFRFRIRSRPRSNHDANLHRRRAVQRDRVRGPVPVRPRRGLVPRVSRRARHLRLEISHVRALGQERHSRGHLRDEDVVPPARGVVERHRAGQRRGRAVRGRDRGPGPAREHQPVARVLLRVELEQPRELLRRPEVILARVRLAVEPIARGGRRRGDEETSSSRSFVVGSRPPRAGHARRRERRARDRRRARGFDRARARSPSGRDARRRERRGGHDARFELRSLVRFQLSYVIDEAPELTSLREARGGVGTAPWSARTSRRSSPGSS